MLAPYFERRFGVEVGWLHGRVRRPKRDELVGRFQDDDGPPVLLVSLKAGGTGLNLTAASHVIHLDRWWNPAVEDQATDRAYRIGQQRTVLVHKLVSTGTVEERIDAMITAKRTLAEQVVGSGEGWITELSTDDLRQVIALRADTVED
jgi:SNF2 family DNA or RNA helicase